MGSGPFGGIYYGQYAPEQEVAGAAEPATISLVAFYQGMVTATGTYDASHSVVAEYQAVAELEFD